MTDESHIEELAQEILAARRTQDRAARRRWQRERSRIAQAALAAQRDAKQHPGNHEKAVLAFTYLALDMACTRALQLERSLDHNEIASPPDPG